jgi:hypothetical protein
MFPNNPLFVDKLLQTKQDDIMRELPDPTTYDFKEANRFPVKLKRKGRILVPVGVLLALAWWLHVLL